VRGERCLWGGGGGDDGGGGGGVCFGTWDDDSRRRDVGEEEPHCTASNYNSYSYSSLYDYDYVL
jgi:hypothetical protein